MNVNINKGVFIALCCLGSSLTWGWPADADCRVGVITNVVGTVGLQRDTRRLVPDEGLRVCRGDRISTGAGSIAEMRLRDGTRITVGKESEFAIREFRIHKHKPNVALFELAKGAFRSITGFITARPHRYEVSTTVATIGIRGTDFWGGYGLTENGLDVVMLEGKGVYVKTAAGQVELTAPGQGTTVSGGVASAAEVWEEGKLKRAVATITP